MNPNTILWIYIVLLVAGGAVGFLKAQSKMSLIMSVGFAALLSLCALGKVFTHPQSADIILVVLLVFFGMRAAKSKKFMPMGMMTIATVLTLAARYFTR